ncbi:MULTISPECIES: ferritin-like protein [Burkholderiaceae]|uniref:ferritin-like domain-containing protein n=1 Tax=Burkholderiaceae TaxID=119060 RepID=UPI00095B721B|nr:MULTISPECIES: ferritin-like protein [Burkholderiaceae]MCG1019956.1 ferritin-like protein [Mycetohabitans sp. B4]SIT80439.1 Ferritin-like [Burkholderia sp. b13]
MQSFRLWRHLALGGQSLVKLAPSGLTTEGGSIEHLLALEFSARDYVTYLLSIDAEIEHCLMVQYLYAGYSLGGPQVPPKFHDAVRNWQETILGIAKEEMGHLITVQNVLRLIGSPLHFERNDYPWDTPFYPFPFMLEPLTLNSLAKYVYAEAPVNWDGGALGEEIRRRVDAQAPCPHHVGELFNTLIPLVNSLPDEVFQADTYRCQADFAEWGRGYHGGQRGSSDRRSLGGTPDVLVMPATSRDDAVNALKAIAKQGEAPHGTNPSHFVRFLRIYVEMHAALEGQLHGQDVWNAARPGDFLEQTWKGAYPKVAVTLYDARTASSGAHAAWQPSLSVAVNPYVSLNTDLEPEQGGTPTTAITEPVTALWASLFNLRYRMLLQYLIHSFTLYGGLRAAGQFTPRGSIINAAFGEMYNLRALSEILMQLPVSTASGAPLAGPPFQVPYTLDSPFGEANRWRGHLDLLAASENLVTNLLAQTDAVHHPYLHSLREADKNITAIARRILSGEVDLALL